MSEDHFLRRWSERKRLVAKEETEARKVEPAPESTSAVEAVEDEPLDLSFLPSLEDLTPTTDLSLFMRKGVPEALRNAALRKMWALDPAVRDYRSEALDYAYDWNIPGGVPGGGELPAGFDSREMVAKIFGDEPVDENVIEDVAAQQSAPQVAGNEAETLGGATCEAPAAGEIPAESCRNEQSTQIQDHAAPQQRKRHGSAIPGLPPLANQKV